MRKFNVVGVTFDLAYSQKHLGISGLNYLTNLHCKNISSNSLKGTYVGINTF